MEYSTFGVLRAPRAILFGDGQRLAIGRVARAIGSRALVCTDARFGASGEMQEIRGTLEAEGIAVAVYTGTEPELPVAGVIECAKSFADFAPDVIIGVGGGSCLDLAKLVSVVLTHGGELASFYGELKVPGPVIPIIAVPTTAGTGSEVTPVAVLADSSRDLKVGVSSPYLIPHTAICDPELTLSCPPKLTAIAGADAMTHAIEAFTAIRHPTSVGLAQDRVFVGKNLISDYHALTAIRAIAKYLPIAVSDGADREARRQLMFGSMVAGLAFGVAGTAAAHAIQYPLGALTKTAHGEGVAALMPFVMRFNRSVRTAELAEIALAMGVETAEPEVLADGAIDRVESLFAEIGIARNLGQLGVKRDQLNWIAEQSMGAARLINNNPRRSIWQVFPKLLMQPLTAKPKLMDSEMAFETNDIPTDLFIGGAWTEGQGGARIAVLNPSSGTAICDVANASIEDGLRAVDAAAAAAEAWKNTAPRQRSEILRKCFELMQRDAEHFAHLISLENGKSIKDARGEVAYAAEFFRWYAEEAVRINGDISIAPSGANRIVVQYQPVGIAMLVTPWNFPAAMATRKIAPALAAGCTCILKPATETPLTAYALARLMSEAGVPDGVVNVLTTATSGKVVGAIMDDARVRKLSFTGSTEVGRVLLRKAADTIINCSMELGGNAPFIVFDDADLDLAVEGAMIAKMRNGGEACTAANRFYVQSGIYDAFAKKFTSRMAALNVGEGVDADTDCGPLINQAACDTIEGLVSDAVGKGAMVLFGGQRINRDGYFFQPTVLGNVPADAKLLREEIFGPVAPLVRFETEAEAIQLANDTEYGLVSYVFTQDLGKGMRVGEAIESGMVALNRGLVSDPAAPFGGVKQSGIGREGAHHGLLDYMEAKYISVVW